MQHLKLLFFALFGICKQLLNLLEVLLVGSNGSLRVILALLKVCSTERLYMTPELIHLFLAHFMHLLLQFELMGLHLEFEIDLAQMCVQLIDFDEKSFFTPRTLLNFFLQVNYDH